MAEFTPITTQEQFDAAIGERIRRERETISKRYGDYNEMKAKIAAYERQIADLTAAEETSAKKYAGYENTLKELEEKVRGYETASVKTRIAHETGIPFELASRLNGDTEDTIRADAEALVKVLGQQKTVNHAAPLRSTEPTGAKNSKDAALSALASQLTKGEA